MWYRLSQQNNTKNIDIPLPNYTYQILSDIQSLGGRTLIVGGAVRDAILGYKPKDIDFEVYGLSYEALQKVLEKYGKTVLEGKAFGVVKFTGKDGSDFDFSLPRTDSKAGVGHKDFSVSTSSDLTPEEAASRRDFTINAISYDPLTKEIIDPYNGREDLKNKILRHTSDSFSDDPLRLLRAMQFGARFGFDLAPETAELARSIKDHYKHLPKERVEAEFKKLVQKGMEPGRALQILYDTGWSENFPEIHNIKDIPQQKEHHPEGNVSTHTMHVMNQAAKIADKNNLTPEERETLIYSALAHDYGKSTHTQLIIDKNGNQKIISPGHEAASGPLAKKFLNSIGVKNKIIDLVVKLVENHMQHLVFENAKYKDAFVKKLSDKLYPSNIKMLNHLIESDHSGRPPLKAELPNSAKQMADLAQLHNVYLKKPDNLLNGEDILKYTGEGGEYVGQILKEHRNLLLNHAPEARDRTSSLHWLDRKMKNKFSFINGNDVINVTGIQGPEISNILNKSWELQKQGKFKDRQSAIYWLKLNYGHE